MADILIYKAHHERFGGERTYGRLLDTDFTFQISDRSHPDSNYIDDDGTVGYAQLGPAAFVTQARYDEPDSAIHSNRLAISSGDGFRYQLTDDTGADIHAPTFFTALGDAVVFLAVNERADTSLAGGEALMVTDGAGAPRLLVEDTISTFWTAGGAIWARESWRAEKDVDLYRVSADLTVDKVYDWTGEDNDIETIEVFEVGGEIYQFAWRENAHDYFRFDGSEGWTPLNLVDFRAVPAGSTSDLFYFWDGRRIDGDSLGTELWASDGSGSGGFMVRDIFPGEGSGYPGDDLAGLTAAVGDRLFFWARAEAEFDGAELFVTDGTAGGTLRLTGRDTPSGGLAGFNSFWDVVALDDDRALIVANGASGTELYVSDGTVDGTGLVADLAPGEDGALPVILETFEGLAYFSISAGADDHNIWRTDGTAEGTFPLDDLRASGNGVRPAMAEVVDLDLGALPFRPIDGTEDGDRLTGFATRDILRGFEGRDRIDGGGGDDLLFGGAARDILRGEAGNDSLMGEDGNDDLDGGAGADHLEGGPGDDRYMIDDPGDRVIEAAGQGVDTIFSADSHVRLGPDAEIEAVQLLGAADLRIDGNAGATRITGNAGDNILIGFGGEDTVTGGAGADAFVFVATGDGPVTVTDFGPGDRLVFDDRYFAGLGDAEIDPRPVTAAQVAAALAAGQVIYDRSSGALQIDSGGGPDLVAILEGAPGFGAADVLIF